jgi:formylglycine-generating enzyme required for sulfatase activity
LDTYEITVGRFRRFVSAFSQAMIAQGAGKNSNNPGDGGWNTDWNDNLDVTSGVLTNNLNCMFDQATWRDTPSVDGENLPINCLTWFEAEAFCIWDGGRLPTEAEWNYAAAGGTSQRVYPWGSTSPSCSYANYYAKDFCVEPPEGYFNKVGVDSPLGDGKYGQADLSGNVSEWVQDWYVTPYLVSCNNCANLIPAANRVSRGAAFDSVPAGLLSSIRSSAPPSARFVELGARCARNL